MDYMRILEATIEASKKRDDVLKTVEDNLKKLQKIVDTVG